LKEQRILRGRGKRGLEMERGTETGIEIGRLRIKIDTRRETFTNGTVIKKEKN
jgi:hypothetical protein